MPHPVALDGPCSIPVQVLLAYGYNHMVVQCIARNPVHCMQHHMQALMQAVCFPKGGTQKLPNHPVAAPVLYRSVHDSVKAPAAGHTYPVVECIMQL